MQVLDDGSHVQLAPERRFHDAVAQLVQPERMARLTQEQAEVLAIVIMAGMATRRRIEEVRGAAQLSIGPEGPVSLPRGQLGDVGFAALCFVRSETIMWWVDRWSTDRRRVYLRLLKAETLQEAKRAIAGPVEHRSQAEPTPGSTSPLGRPFVSFVIH